MAQRDIKMVAKMVHNLTKVDPSMLNFGKAVSSDEVADHELIKEIVQDLRSYVTSLQVEEEKYARQHYMKSEIDNLFNAYKDDPEKLQEILQNAVAQHNQQNANQESEHHGMQH